MKILLTHAYFLRCDPAEQAVMRPYPPLGLLYLSAWLKGMGHDVRVFDGTFRRPEEFTEELRHFRPGVVGFYANMMTRHQVLALRAAIDDPGIRIAVGGPDPPTYADDYLDRGFDVVINGEGEHSFGAWLAAIDTPERWPAVEGLIFRHQGETVRTPPRKRQASLDDFPFPDRAAIDLETYLDCWQRHHGVRPISLITSRGCPYRCTWCSHNVYGHSLRKRSPENVVAEMDALASRYRFDRYWFADDVFNIKRDWLFALNATMSPRQRRDFECIVRANRLDEEVVDVLARMGAAKVWVGAESGSQRLLNQMKRAVDREEVIGAVRNLRAAGIETGMFFMWGFGDERLEDILATVDLVARCAPDTALTTVAYPIRGTRFYDQLAEAGRLGSLPNFEQGTDRDIPISGRPDRELYRLADRLLHAALREVRCRQGGSRLKTLAHHLRRRLFEVRLRAAHRRQERSIATTGRPSAPVASES